MQLLQRSIDQSIKMYFVSSEGMLADSGQTID